MKRPDPNLNPLIVRAAVLRAGGLSLRGTAAALNRSVAGVHHWQMRFPETFAAAAREVDRVLAAAEPQIAAAAAQVLEQHR